MAFVHILSAFVPRSFLVENAVVVVVAFLALLFPDLAPYLLTY